MTELYKFAIVPFEDVVEHGVLQGGDDSDLLWSQANLVVTYFLLIYSISENAIDWTETLLLFSVYCVQSQMFATIVSGISSFWLLLFFSLLIRDFHISWE